MTINIDINNSYIREAFQAAYDRLYEPAQRNYDRVNNNEVYQYWSEQVIRLLCAENKFTVDSNTVDLPPKELIFEYESDLIMFKLKYSN